jgi:hypothetical protein
LVPIKIPIFLSEVLQEEKFWNLALANMNIQNLKVVVSPIFPKEIVGQFLLFAKAFLVVVRQPKIHKG